MPIGNIFQLVFLPSTISSPLRILQEAKVALARLYQRLRFELEAGQVPLATTAALTLAPRDGLWLRPVLRPQRGSGGPCTAPQH